MSGREFKLSRLRRSYMHNTPPMGGARRRHVAMVYVNGRYQTRKNTKRLYQLTPRPEQIHWSALFSCKPERLLPETGKDAVLSWDQATESERIPIPRSSLCLSILPLSTSLISPTTHHAGTHMRRMYKLGRIAR